MKTNLTMQALGQLISRNDRTTHAQSAPLHAAFKKANAQGQRDMREQFICGFIADDLGISTTQANKIIAQSRTDRSDKNQKSFNNGRRQFDHHVRRGVTMKTIKGKKARKSKKNNALNAVMKTVVGDFSALKKAMRKLSPVNARKIDAKLRALVREAKSLAK